MQQNKKGDIGTETLIKFVLGAIVIFVVTFMIYGPAQAAYSRGTCEGNQGTCDEKAYVYVDGSYQCNQNAGYIPTTFQCKNKIDKRYTPRPCCLFISDEEREQERARDDVAEMGSGAEKIADMGGVIETIEREQQEEPAKTFDEQYRESVERRVQRLKQEFAETRDPGDQNELRRELLVAYLELKDYPNIISVLREISEQYPDKRIASIAQYRIGDLYANNKLEVYNPYLATASYEEFLDEYPEYAESSEVYIDLFKLYIVDLKDPGKAQEYYELIKAETPEYVQEADAIRELAQVPEEQS